MTAPFINQNRQVYVVNPEEIASSIADNFADNSGTNVLIPPIGFVPVSQLSTLHDGKILNRDLPEMYEVVGDGTGTYGDGNKYTMAVGANEWLVRQSKHIFPYFSGKPTKVELTYDNFAPEANVTKRVGYFSSNIVSPFDADYDGFYLESNFIDGIKFVIVNDGTITYEVTLENWSGYDNLQEYQTLATWDNFTVAEINFLWLGGAYIELKVMTSGGFVTAHTHIHAGTQTDVFIKSPNQPIRYEIRSTGGTGTLRYICNQVATGGSINESGYGRTLDTTHTPITLTGAGTLFPLLGIKKQTAYRHNPVVINVGDVFVASNDRVRWSLLLNPTISGAGLSYSDVDTTVVQKATGDGVLTVTDIGFEIAAGFLEQGKSISASTFTSNYLMWLSGNIDGTQNAIVLCVTPVTSPVNVHGVIDFEEG